MAKFNSQLKGTKDMMKELNNTQGRYIPVWLQSAASSLKAAITKTKKSERTKGNGSKKEKEKSSK